MRNPRTPLALLMLLSMYGCATTPKQYVVTFDSTPQGATLICDGKNWGYTPRNLYYDESVKEQPSINVSGCSANWSSGAKNTYPRNLRVFAQGGTTINLKRPDVAGYSQDANFALQVKNMQAQQRQANAAQSQANAAQSQANTALYEQYKVKRPKTCVTNLNITTCF